MNCDGTRGEGDGVRVHSDEKVVHRKCQKGFEMGERTVVG